jgi:cytochrome P450
VTVPVLDVYPLGDSAFTADPYPAWAEIRALGPVVFWPAANAYLVTGFDLAAETLRSADRFSPSRLYRRSGARTAAAAPAGSILAELEANALFHLDSAAHRRIRTLVNASFTSRSVERIQPHISATVEAALQRHRSPSGVLDVAAVAATLPLAVLGDWLGFSADATELLVSHTESVSALTDPLTRTAPEQLESDLRTLKDLLGTEVESRRSAPRQDLLSDLLAPSPSGDALTDDEVFALLVALLMAGAETTGSWLSIGSLELARDPAVMAALVADPSLIEPAMLEALRFSYIGLGIARFSISDTQLGGVEIEAGSLVMVAVGAALRDPAVVSDPDRFMIDRVQPPNLVFGSGPRFCLGIHLAQATARTFFTALLAGGEFELAGTPKFTEHVVFRQLETLSVRYR